MCEIFEFIPTLFQALLPQLRRLATKPNEIWLQNRVLDYPTAAAAQVAYGDLLPFYYKNPLPPLPIHVVRSPPDQLREKNYMCKW